MQNCTESRVILFTDQFGEQGSRTGCRTGFQIATERTGQQARRRAALRPELTPRTVIGTLVTRLRFQESFPLLCRFTLHFPFRSQLRFQRGVGFLRLLLCILAVHIQHRGCQRRTFALYRQVILHLLYITVYIHSVVGVVGVTTQVSNILRLVSLVADDEGAVTDGRRRGAAAALFCMTGTDGRSHVAVFTTSAAARTARNRHGVAVTGGFALVVNIAPAKRSRIQFVFVVRCRGRNHRAIKLGVVSDRDIKTTFSGIDTALVSDALTTLGDVFARGVDVTGRRAIAQRRNAQAQARAG
ncbi:hypothetical protein F384_16575 [Citrobacter amalonaticus Y19]|uniref:Uncharacterized protein n=1 Tax=Citrobacter amalonaticus Y19 TaxID=1261127 RepID=A0A0F6TWK0_CITAM|nr:hypothetical protein F384_16575 [Citrobacter amalonaticus Y19]